MHADKSQYLTEPSEIIIGFLVFDDVIKGIEQDRTSFYETMGYSSVHGFFSVAIEVAMISLNSLLLYSCAFIKAKRENSEVDDIAS